VAEAHKASLEGSGACPASQVWVGRKVVEVVVGEVLLEETPHFSSECDFSRDSVL